MRTYRGKTEQGEWVYGYLTHNKSTNNSWIGDFAFNNYYHTKVIPETVGQCTGLKDKSGESIYEGDIVKCPVKINPHIHSKFTNRLVKWKKDSFTWVFDGEYAWCRFEDSVTGDGDYIKYTEDGIDILIEIIGNIHDNPELITKH